jgi:signal transduction histidine kinase
MPSLEGHELLVQLAEIGAKTQRMRTVDEVLQTAGTGVMDIGLRLLAVKLENDRLVLQHVAAPGLAARDIEQMLGRPVKGLVGPGPGDAPASRVLQERKTRYFDDLTAWLTQFFGEFSAVEIDLLTAAFRHTGCTRGVLTPVWVREQQWGVVAVWSSSELGERDVPALSLFASLLGSALETAEAFENLERRNRELAAVHSIARAAHAPEFERLVPKLMEICAVATASDTCAIYLIAPNGVELVQVAPPYGPVAALSQHRIVSIDKGPTAEAFRVMRPIAFNTGITVSQLGAAVKHAGVMEVAVVPMHLSGRLYGTIYLSRNTARPYTAEELRSAEILGGQVAIQVENSLLYEDARRRLRQLTVLFNLARQGTGAREVVPLVQRMMGEVCDGLQADGAEIAFAGVDGQLAGTVHRVRAGRELRGLELSTPMLSGERMLGTFTVFRASERPFTDEERRLFEGCAALVAVSIEHARLFDEQRRRVQDLSLINEIGGLIARHLDLPALLSTGVRHLSRLADVPNVYLLRLTPSGEALRVEASTLDGALEAVVPLTPGTAAAQAMKEQRPVVIRDTAQSTVSQGELAARFGHTAMLVLPLIAEGRSVGLVVLGETRGIRLFPPDEVDRAVAVANQLASGLSNAQLFDDLKKSYAQLSQAQAELVRHERLVALGELAGVMAHEVRNPLGVIFNSLGSLKRILKPSGDTELLLHIVAEEAERLDRIVGDLLVFARPSDASLKPSALDELISSAVEAAYQAVPDSEVEVQVDIPSPLPALSVDNQMLRQALMNLIINALQAMPKGGIARVHAELEERGGVPTVRIDVADHGAGISSSNADRIFQPFFTTKASGTGLGLTVVKRIIDAHHGEVEMRPGEEGGTVFRVRLPVRATVATTR